MKKLVLVALVVWWAAAPAVAQQRPTRECNRLTQQIARYQRDAGWAEERENPLWEQASLNQVERLARRRVKRCPQYAEQESVLVKIGELIVIAGRLAARYFLMGL